MASLPEALNSVCTAETTRRLLLTSSSIFLLHNYVVIRDRRRAIDKASRTVGAVDD